MQTDTCFTKAQLISLLDLFKNSLEDPLFKMKLRGLAPDMTKMEDYLMEYQTELISKHYPGWDPKVVFSDLGRATMVFRGDHEIISALANISFAEERALKIASTPEANPAPTAAIELNPHILQQLQDMAAKNPEGFKKQQAMIQTIYSSSDAVAMIEQKLKDLEHSDPQGYTMLSQTLAAAALFAPVQTHAHHNPSHTHSSSSSAPITDPTEEDMPPLSTGSDDDDLEDNMN